MSLQARLDAFKADFEAGKPPYSVLRSVIETMHRATVELIASGAAQRARKAGDVAPSFSLKDPEGNVVNSSALLKRGPLVLSFYRGVWCPYCNMELQALEAAKPEFDKYGASLIAISPQTAPNSRKSVRQNKLSFPILSDVKGKVGAAFGLRFNLPDYLVELLQAAEERSDDVQRRSELDAADAGPLRHRTGRRHPLLRSKPRLHPPARS
jgi:peroxiredoxin